MAIAEMMLPEFQMEMASTRRTLERVPADKFDWQPHEKSSSMGVLSAHLANIPTWVGITIDRDVFDLAPLGAPPRRDGAPASTEELLARFDKNVADASACLSGAADEHLKQAWILQRGGVDLMSLPRVAVLRSFVMSHNIHHRAQLGLYLRLNDIAVPSIYGPSADEEPRFS